MELTCEEVQGTCIIRARLARIDAGIALAFTQNMGELTKGRAERMIVDMSEVQFIDSSGLGAVVASLKQVEKGGSLELAGLTIGVKKLFSLTKMDTVFKVHASVEDGLASEVAA